MTIIEVPITNVEVWHGSSRSDRIFLRDQVAFWFEAHHTPIRCYFTVFEFEDNSHGIFLFDDPEIAILFKLRWCAL